jgi:hypothetical protein
VASEIIGRGCVGSAGPAPSAPERKAGPSLEERPRGAGLRLRLRRDHHPDGFERYVERVATEHPWVHACRSLPYKGQRGIRHGVFHVRDGAPARLVGEYRHGGFGARFEILLAPGSTSDQLEAAARLLAAWARRVA